MRGPAPPRSDTRNCPGGPTRFRRWRIACSTPRFQSARGRRPRTGPRPVSRNIRRWAVAGDLLSAASARRHDTARFAASPSGGRRRAGRGAATRRRTRSRSGERGAATGPGTRRFGAKSGHQNSVTVMVWSSAVAGRVSPMISIVVWFEPGNFVRSPHPDLNRRPRSYQGLRSQRCGTHQ